MNCDILIIGAGILGSMTARELSKYNLDIVVADKAYDIGEGTAKANGGIIHAGFHPREGSLKGISCAIGNEMYTKICDDLDIQFKRIGSLFVVFHREGLEQLDKKYKRGLANGVPNMRIIESDEIMQMEPRLSKDIIKALYAPTTGIISPFELIYAVSQSACINGVDFNFGTEITHIEKCEEYYIAKTNKGDIRAKYIVNTSGGGANLIDSFVKPTDLKIKPRRGQFYILDKEAGNLINHVIYQAQEDDEGGTFMSLTVDGNLLVGPTSENVRDFSRAETTEKGLAHIEKVAKKIIPDFDMSYVITNFAGIRSNITNVEKDQKDFVVRASSERFISALGIKNPGMTSAPHLACLIVNLLEKEGLKLEKKKKYNPERKAIKLFLKQEKNMQEILLEENKLNSKIVCRCENITEGDILNIMRSPLPPRSLDGVKKRLRVGMGRCQGGFCTPRLIDILSRELSIPPEDILKNTGKSYVIKGRVK